MKQWLSRVACLSTLLVVGVDEMAAVMQGSVLWLDCSGLTSNPDNLLMVNWRKNKGLFYTQLNNPTLKALGRIGFPANSSLGQTLGSRYTLVLHGEKPSEHNTALQKSQH